MIELSSAGKRKCMQFKVDGETCAVPLGTALTVKEIIDFKSCSGDGEAQTVYLYRLFERYAGEDVMAKLMPEDLQALIEEWSKASSDGGVGMGES